MIKPLLSTGFKGAFRAHTFSILYKVYRELLFKRKIPVIAIRFANQMVNLDRFFPHTAKNRMTARTSNLDPQRTGSSIFAILPHVS